jgi:hypothetical protein
VIVTVAVAAALPLRVSGFGDTVQVVNAGLPEHANDTLVFKLIVGARESVYEAVWPAVTVTLVGEVVLSAKSGPVPDSNTECGVPVALSAIAIFAVLAPGPVGLKVTLIWQFAPAAIPVPQVFVCAKSPAFVPAIARLEILRAAVPVFVNCTT